MSIVQSLRENGGSEPYISHGGQIGYIGVSKDSDLCVGKGQLLREIWLGIGTNLASLHVLEVHSYLRRNALTESQVRGSELTWVRPDLSISVLSHHTSKAYSLSPGSWTGVANFLN